MAKDVTVTPNANGSATVSFGVTYGVSNTHSAPGVRGDQSTILLRVARQLLPSGPAAYDPVFTKMIVDNHLDQAVTTHTYSVTLPASSVSFLKSQGLAFVKSKESTTTTTVPSTTPTGIAALKLVSVDVEQHRDFKHVDGSFDWTEGNFFTAASHPLGTATTHGGTLTVENETQYICNFSLGSNTTITNYGFLGSYNNCQYAGPATPLQLSGVATQCFNQDSSSNPEGFAQANSADVGTPEADGASITEPVVANDGSSPFAASTEAINANWAVTVGKAALSVGVSLLAGGPIGTVVTGILGVFGFLSGSSCDNDPNVMTLSATDTAGGGGSSDAWAIDEEGLQNIYGSSFNNGNGGPIEAVQNAYSSQVYAPAGQTPQNIWLGQNVVANCGVGNGNDCPDNSTDSVIDFEWSTNNTCPMAYNFTFNKILQNGNPTRCASVTPTSPPVSDCGTNNSTCPSQTPPGPTLVPDIIGEPVSQATSTLAKSGLGIYPTNLSPSATIATESPNWNTSVETPYVVQVTTTSPPPTTTTTSPPTTTTTSPPTTTTVPPTTTTTSPPPTTVPSTTTTAPAGTTSALLGHGTFGTAVLAKRERGHRTLALPVWVSSHDTS
jgi:hypothetical protein